MNIIYFGNGPFAVPSLMALAKSKHRLLAVVARPDRPAGKSARIVPGPVAAAAAELGLPLHQPESANAPEFLEILRPFSADLFVVADFGQILSADLLAIPRLGGINIHGSLLPKYRGAAPVAWAIFQGDAESGVSVLQMTPKMDAGGVVLQESTPIEPEETAGELEARLARIGARLSVEAADALASGKANRIEQDPNLVSKAPKLKKEDGRIQWNRTALLIKAQVRAMLPWPGCFVDVPREGKEPLRLRVLKVAAIEAAPAAAPGTVVKSEAQALHVACGEGAVALMEVQPAGKNPLDIASFLRGYRIPLGTSLT
ncbi:MAG TPA: methionyl-tRNA formyltransferase [Planctomycetia bacterium]|nr:methionyl-tRNA formyltransferase [Planctomycetia bacterium]